MKVAIINGEAEIVVSDDGPYQPSVMRDLCDNARRLYEQAFPDEEPDEADTGTQQG